MTKTFERFLRGFSDEELVAFAHDRRAMHPPYWRVMALALRIEADRRGIRLDDDALAASPDAGPSQPVRTGTA